MFKYNIVPIQYSKNQMSNFLTFLSGTIFGMYLAQNYQVPDIKTSSTILINYLKALEKQERENNDLDDSNHNK